MSRLKKDKTSSSPRRNMIALKGGSYSLVITVIVLAILIAVNVLSAVMPATITKYDISSSRLYSITSNTKVVVNALEKDVTIYWIVQSDKEDDIIETLLDKYDSLSDHINVVKKNPDVYPTFTAQYTDEDVANNSLIVECGDKSRYISYNDIYVADTDAYSYYGYNTSYSFDGEGAITSAIDYVTRDDLPQLYVLEGHGEADLPTTFKNQLSKDNIELNSFSLLNEDEIPEDADCIMIYAPSSDISEEEKNILAEYVSSGGRLFVTAGPVEEGTLTNLYSLISDYGITATDGVVVESDREHYAFQRPYILMPDMASSDITDPLIDEHYYPIIPIAQGLIVGSSNNGASVTTLLTTSDTAFSKADGYNITTYEKEEGDTDGPFALGVTIQTSGAGQIVWISSSYFLDDVYNSYSSGANIDLAMNSLSSMIGDSETISIRSKSLSYNYLTISESTSSLLKVLMIGVFPLVFLGIGIAVVAIRRGLQNEKA